MLRLLFREIPWRFSLPFGLLTVLLLALIGRLGRPIAGRLHEIGLRDGHPFLSDLVSGLVFIGLAVAMLATVAAAILISYNLTVALYRVIRPRPGLPSAGEREAEESKVSDTARLRLLGRPDQLSRFQEKHGLEELKIGIILAGGGAKGAYQAGALRAVHEFLEANKALDKVRMIAGTSIGAWNAMFWLAGLVRPPEGEKRSVHERWWRSIEVRRVIEPDFFLPGRNHLFSNRPWREAFRKIFLEPPEVRERLERLFAPSADAAAPYPHFYLTRTNVERGVLEFATNNPAAARRGQASQADVLLGPGLLEEAVFASMDLPPLFQYARIETDRPEYFEDGGVVENLPLRFGTQFEGCNLLFVLPLNASFETQIDTRSMIRRLSRVMDVRQGVLERQSLKLAYLYNDRARMLRALDEAKKEELDLGGSTDLVSIFAICPQQPSIGTSEFWKRQTAGEAYRLMYSATRSELAHDDFVDEKTNPAWIQMTLVQPGGGFSYFWDF